MKNLFLLAIAGLVFTTACKKDDTTTPTPVTTTKQVMGAFSAANSIKPTSTSTATGTATGTYDPTTKVLTYSLTYSGLTGAPTSAHFHYGDPKHTGSVFVPFSNIPTGTSGTISGSTTLTTTTTTVPAVSQPDSLTLGHVYANIHTAAYPGGEIRANLTVK